MSASDSSDSEDYVPLKPATGGSLEIKPTLSDFASAEVVNRCCPVPPTSMKAVLNELKRHAGPPKSADRTVLMTDLFDFEIYRTPDNASKFSFELASLHLLVKSKTLSFSGTIQLENSKSYYVENVEIAEHSIEGYGNEEDPRIVIYVRPKYVIYDRDFDIWIRLHRPAPRYERFHTAFHWVATFARYALDFMEAQPPKSVTLEDFQSKFLLWINARFAYNRVFEAWHSASASTFSGNRIVDFRASFNAYADYIYQQAGGLDSWKVLLAHPVWGHCLQSCWDIEKKDVVEIETIATPHVHQCFKHMYFGGKIKPVRPCRDVRVERANRKRRLGFPSNDSNNKDQGIDLGKQRPRKIQAGDVIAFEPEEEDTMYWKKTGSEWLAYVQRVEPMNDTAERFDGTEQLLRLFVLWIYRPEDTHMFLAHYPILKEVFLSDNCNCSEGVLLSTEVRKITVDWKPDSLDTNSDYLVRQTYITENSSFITMQNEHLTCNCNREKDEQVLLSCYKPGQTMYITKSRKGQKTLEPVLVHRIHKDSGTLSVKRLLRLRDCSNMGIMGIPKRDTGIIARNELVLTDELFYVRPRQIVADRPCHIRFLHRSAVTTTGKIPFPYDRGGAGDFWFISMGLVKSKVTGTDELKYLSRLPDNFKQSEYAERPDSERLRGLSIFSGGGNLDRGLEDGGAVEFKIAVDFSLEAMHTQRANARNPKSTDFWCGSVDDHLSQIFSGDIPLPAVDCISAGSPCPGFSVAQQNFLSDMSLANASHISTFCSYVDIVRPKYGVLENVVNMASTRKGFESENVMSQLVACLVSLGYQVNQFIMDAWCYGSSQHRSRVFLVIAAPGLPPILQPKHTHNRPYEDMRSRSLGTLPNGMKFGERDFYPTPFPMVTAGESTADLPEIGNAHMQLCITHPDHRLSYSYNKDDRGLIQRVPRYPGSNYAKALQQGLIPVALQKSHKKELGHCYERVKEKGLFPTITTSLGPQNGRGGSSLHWSEPRTFSIMEARRAQGYLDSEVIVGKPARQWTIIGNGVDRKVSLALGLSLNKAVAAMASPETPRPLIISQAAMLPNHVLQSIPSKRTYEISMEADAAMTPFSSFNSVNKRVKHVEVQIKVRTSQTILGTGTTVEADTQLVETKSRPVKSNTHSIEANNHSKESNNQSLRSALTPSSKCSPKRRYTRMSGLVEFAPTSWSKRPEQREVREALLAAHISEW